MRTTATLSSGARPFDSKPGSTYSVSQGKPVPEAKNIRWLNDLYKPVVALDLHHQGSRVHDGQMVTASTLYPTADQTAQRLLGVDPQAVNRFNAGKEMGNGWWSSLRRRWGSIPTPT